MSNRTAAEYISSRPGYSWAGQLITYGALPWFVGVAYAVPIPPPGVGGYLVSVVMFAPAAIWLVAKFLGPGRWSGWFFREPASCIFDTSEIRWQSHFAGPFRRPELVRIPWSDFGGVELRSLQLSVVGPDGAKIRNLPPDLERLRPLDRLVEYTFAQALVAYRPGDFVTADPVRWGRPGGVRPRTAGEPTSTIETQPVSRLQQRLLVIYLMAVFVAAVVTTQLRQ